MRKIGELQRAILTALRASEDEMTTLEIYEALAGKYAPLSMSSIFIPLDRMTKSGLVTSRKGDPMPIRGGKSRLYYKITNDGLECLRHKELDLKKVSLIGSGRIIPAS